MRYTKIFFLLLLITLVHTVPAQNMPADSLRLSALLPDSVNGWYPVPPDQIYHPDNLYDYMDGGAEIYRAYDVKILLHRLYHHPDQPDIIIDIYDMGKGENSFGLFLQQATNPDTFPKFGQGSQLSDGYLLFWKGPYFINAVSFPQTAQSRQTLQAIATHIDKQIKRKAPYPILLNLLPANGRLEHSLRYYHAYFFLQRLFQLPAQNIFLIEKDVKIASARYQDGTTLAILYYPSTSRAKKALQSVQQAMPFSHQKPFTIKNGIGFLLERHMNFLLFARNKQSPQAIKAYSGLLDRRLPKSRINFH